jgi:effector-binding domain-containing protein
MKRVEQIRYRYVEREVTLSELDDFLAEAVGALRRQATDGAPFAIFHGAVNDTTRSRVEVGAGAPDGERTLPGGSVVYAVAGSDRGETGYAEIHELYAHIARYIDENGLRQTGATREVYTGRDHFGDEIEVVWPVEG